jgi:hypothetical protein
VAAGVEVFALSRVGAFMRSELMVVVISPRDFLMLSMPRETNPRLVQ